MFFDQTFKIYFDDGRFVETNDLITWLRTYHGGAEKIYYRMKWLCKYEKSKWDYFSYNPRQYLEYSELYLYTSNGLMVSPELFKGEYFNHIYRGYSDYNFRLRRYGHNRHTSHSTTVIRHMETMAERRAISAVIKEEGEPDFRPRRKNIPDPWNNEIISRKSLSWKNCTKRKQQYKGS